MAKDTPTPEASAAGAALARAAWAKRTPEERAAIEAKRQAGCKAMTRADRAARARAGWRTRLGIKPAAPPEPAATAAPRPQVEPPPRTPLQDAASRVLESFDSASDRELLEALEALFRG